MTTRSIFQKVCPSCMATVSLDSRQCSCGHLFDHDDTDANLSSEEIRLKAELLYESYLAARSEQAANAARAAQAAFAADPSNLDKSERVASTISEAQSAAAALTAQSVRIAEMKQTMRPVEPPPRPAPAPAAPKRRVAPRKSATVEPARTARKVITTVVHVAASARAKRNSKPVALTAAKNPPAPAAAAPVPKTPAVAHPGQTAAPNPAFRQAQAAKADKILRTVRATAPAPQRKKESTPVLPVPEKKITPVMDVPASTKLAPRLYKAEKKKDCPNCTSSVDINASCCRCGYEFPSSEQLIPPLAMSDEERAEFAKLFNFL